MEFGPDLTPSTRQGRATSVFIYVSKRHMQGKRWAGLSTSYLVGNIPWQWVGVNKEWCTAKCFAWFCPINSKYLLRSKDQRLLKIRGLLFWQMENLPWFRGREGFKYFIHNFTQGQYAWCKVVIWFLKHILTLKTSQLSQQLCFSEAIDCTRSFPFFCFQGPFRWFQFLCCTMVGLQTAAGSPALSIGGLLFIVGLVSGSADRYSRLEEAYAGA